MPNCFRSFRRSLSPTQILFLGYFSERIQTTFWKCMHRAWRCWHTKHKWETFSRKGRSTRGAFGAERAEFWVSGWGAWAWPRPRALLNEAKRGVQMWADPKQKPHWLIAPDQQRVSNLSTSTNANDKSKDCEPPLGASLWHRQTAVWATSSRMIWVKIDPILSNITLCNASVVT